MKNTSHILKIFLLDWLITVLMYVVGVLVSVVGAEKNIDVLKHVDLIKTNSSSGNVLSTLIYLITSISMVILFSLLINLSKIKAPWKDFIISQLLYVLSVAFIIILLPLFL